MLRLASVPEARCPGYAVFASKLIASCSEAGDSPPHRYVMIQLEYSVGLLHYKFEQLGNHLEYVAINKCNFDSTAVYSA